MFVDATFRPQDPLQRIRRLSHWLAWVCMAKTDPARKSGGTLGMGVEQDSLVSAVTDPTLVNTRWETWLQTKKVDGFFEVWSGTPAQLQKQGIGKK